MRKVVFVTKGLSLVGANDWKEGITARQSTGTQGIDIYFVLDERRYRFDIYTATHDGIVKTSTKYMHESRIDTADAWEA